MNLDYTIELKLAHEKVETINTEANMPRHSWSKESKKTQQHLEVIWIGLLKILKVFEIGMD